MRSREGSCGGQGFSRVARGGDDTDVRVNGIIDEDTKNEVPPLNIAQQVFKCINKQHSWTVKGNQGFEDGQLNDAKILVDDVFHVVFEKPLDKYTSLDDNKKDDNT